MGLRVPNVRNVAIPHREEMRPQAANQITTSKDLARAIAEDAAWGGGWARGTESGSPVTVTSAMRVATVSRCVRLVASHIGGAPLVLYRVSSDRKEPDTSNVLYRLLKVQPNERQTAFEFREMLQRDYELRGNGYALKVFGWGGRIVELIRLHPDRVEPKEDALGRLVYEHTSANGRREIYQQREIMHLRGMSDDGIKGLSTLQEHAETIGLAMATRQHAARFFRNGAKPLGTIELDSAMDEASRKEFREDWDDVYSGGANAHKTLLLPPGMKYNPVSISPKDQQLIEAQKWSVSEIARAFGIPPHKVGDLEKATFSNIEHQSIEFVQDALVPRAERWEDVIQRDLIGAEDTTRFAKFNFGYLLRGDAKARAEALQIQRRNGVINADEWRDIEDMNPREDPGGKEYIVEGNMRIQDGAKPPEQQPQPAAGGQKEPPK